MRPAREILISLGVYLYTCDDLPTFSAPHILLPEPDLPCPPFLADAFFGREGLQAGVGAEFRAQADSLKAC